MFHLSLSHNSEEHHLRHFTCFSAITKSIHHIIVDLFPNHTIVIYTKMPVYFILFWHMNFYFNHRLFGGISPPTVQEIRQIFQWVGNRPCCVLSLDYATFHRVVPGVKYLGFLPKRDHLCIFVLPNWKCYSTGSFQTVPSFLWPHRSALV